METVFTKGQNKKFVAKISFGLNWDDRNIKSIKIKEGQEISYDGEIAIVNNGGGDVRGRCMGLRSAINAMHWLIPVEGEKVPESSKVPEIVTESLFQDEDYEPHKGGNLDTYIKRNNNIAGKREIIKEDDLIVKKIPSINKEKTVVKSGKLEIAGDQVEVPKDRLIVSSTTVRTKSSKRNVVVTNADEMGADSVLPLKRTGVVTRSEKKNAFVVDNSTPRQIHDDMTRDEVQRITKVVNADDSQNAIVVRKIDTSKVEVKEIEGITLKKTSSPQDMTFKKIDSPTGMTIKTTVGAGNNQSAGGDQGAVVVGVSKTAKIVSSDKIDDTIEAPEPTDEEKVAALIELKEREKKAKARATSRKNKSVETQKLMEKEKKSEKLDINKTPELVEEIKPDTEVTKITSVDGATTDYLLTLPDNWGKMHWVKKEQFIKEIKDVYFIKFILSMENTKAVKNACLERLEELGHEESG